MTNEANRVIGYRHHLPHHTGVQHRACIAPANSANVGNTFLAVLLLSTVAICPQPSAAQPLIELMSVSVGGQSAEGDSNTPTPNANGSVVAFSSNAFNLVLPLEANQQSDVYARVLSDLPFTERVSVSVDGGEPNGASQRSGFAPGISGNGELVAFSSRATDLIPGGTDGRENVFVYDRAAGVTERISIGINGEPNGASTFADSSASGRYVVFQSAASNLIENDTNGVLDVFLFDRETDTTRRISVASDGQQSDGPSLTPAISDNGLVVAFASGATNLVTEDTNRVNQIYVHEWQSGLTALVSVSSGGRVGNRASFLPDLNADGSVVAFKSEAFNLVAGDTLGWPDVFVHSRASGETERVSVDSFGNQANDLSSGPGISNDGRFVAFVSFASNLVPDDANLFSDVYVFDRTIRAIARVTVSLDGSEPNAGVPDFPPRVSADGRWIGFASDASNLVPNDINNATDAFLACNPFDETRCAQEPAPCVGDCNDDGVVTIDDLIKMVAIALGADVCGNGVLGGCLAGDANCDCEITVDEIVRAVNNLLFGCFDFGDCSLAEHEAICCGP